MTHRSADAASFLARAAIALCLNLWGCGESSESGLWPTVPEIGPTSVTIHLGDVPLAKTLHDMSHSATVSWHRPARRHTWYRSLDYDEVVVELEGQELLRTKRARVRIIAPANLPLDHPCNIIESIWIAPRHASAWSVDEARVQYERSRTALDRLGARMIVFKNNDVELSRAWAIEDLRSDSRARADASFWRECIAGAGLHEVKFQTASNVKVELKFACESGGTVSDVTGVGVRLASAELYYFLGNSKCFGPGGIDDLDVWDRWAPEDSPVERLATDAEIKESRDTAGPL